MNTTITIKWLLPFAFAMVGVTTLAEFLHLLSPKKCNNLDDVEYSIAKFENAKRQSDSLTMELEYLRFNNGEKFKQVEEDAQFVKSRLKEIGEKRKKRKSVKKQLPDSQYQTRFTNIKEQFKN